jgi:DNA topoisomerase I
VERDGLGGRRGCGNRGRRGLAGCQEAAVGRAVEQVSAYLGNTPAVCRASYVDPRVFDRFDAGITIADALKRLVDDELGDPVGQARIVRAVLDLRRGAAPD